MKCRSMHTYFWMSFPFASPCSLKGEIRAEVTGDRFNFVQAGIKRQPSLAAALFRLHWCWCCCWCKKVPGRQHQHQLERRRRLVLTLCQTGRRLWQASPDLAHAPTAGLVLRNATLSCLQCCAREILCYGAALFRAVVHFPTCSVDVPCAGSNSFLLYQALEKFSMQRQS